MTVQQPLPEIELEQPEFVVGGIIKREWNASSKEYLWLVTWDGYLASENSWEPESCFKTADTINDIWKSFEENHLRLGRRKAQTQKGKT